MKHRLYLLFFVIFIASSIIPLFGASAQDPDPKSVESENLPDSIEFFGVEVASTLPEPIPTGLPLEIGDKVQILELASFKHDGNPVWIAGKPVGCKGEDCFWRGYLFCNYQPGIAAPVVKDVYTYKGNNIFEKQGVQDLKWLKLFSWKVNLSFEVQAGCAKCITSIQVLQSPDGVTWDKEVFFVTLPPETTRYLTTIKVEALYDFKIIVQFCDGSIVTTPPFDVNGDYSYPTIIIGGGTCSLFMPWISGDRPCPSDILANVLASGVNKWGVFSQEGFVIGSKSKPVLVANGSKITINYRKGTQAASNLQPLPEGGTTIRCLNGNCQPDYGRGPQIILWGGTDLIGTNVYNIECSFPFGSKSCKGTIWVKDPPTALVNLMDSAPSKEASDRIFLAYASAYYADASEADCLKAAQNMATTVAIEASQSK